MSRVLPDMTSDTSTGYNKAFMRALQRTRIQPVVLCGGKDLRFMSIDDKNRLHIAPYIPLPSDSQQFILTNAALNDNTAANTTVTPTHNSWGVGLDFFIWNINITLNACSNEPFRLPHECIRIYVSDGTAIRWLNTLNANNVALGYDSAAGHWYFSKNYSLTIPIRIINTGSITCNILNLMGAQIPAGNLLIYFEGIAYDT